MERDARTLNRMGADAKLIHLRLEVWARWSKENVQSGAWARANTISRMMVYGAVGASQSGAPVEMPEPIAETECAVRCLPAAEQSAVRRYYLHWEPSEVAARHLRLTVRELQRLLHRARMQIQFTLEYQSRNAAKISPI
jgi:predicted amidohydrolase YtcJ